MTTETLLRLPKRKTFRGDNVLYLSARSIPVVDKLTYLQFDSIKKTEETVMIEISIHSSPKKKHIMLKSEHVNKYWKRDSTTDLILVNTDVPDPIDPDMVFEMVGPTDGFITLRNLGNNMYCGRQTIDIDIVRNANCLRACFPDTTAKETHMEYEDL